MTVKRDSWHYRLMLRYNNMTRLGMIPMVPTGEASMPKSLCSYFWTLVGCLTVFPIAFAIIAILSIVFWYGVILPIRGIIYLVRFVLGKRKKSNDPNLLVEFVKARKSKVCPLITYK